MKPEQFFPVIISFISRFTGKSSQTEAAQDSASPGLSRDTSDPWCPQWPVLHWDIPSAGNRNDSSLWVLINQLSAYKQLPPLLRHFLGMLTHSAGTALLLLIIISKEPSLSFILAPFAVPAAHLCVPHGVNSTTFAQSQHVILLQSCTPPAQLTSAPAQKQALQKLQDLSLVLFFHKHVCV